MHPIEIKCHSCIALLTFEKAFLLKSEGLKFVPSFNSSCVLVLSLTCLRRSHPVIMSVEPIPRGAQGGMGRREVGDWDLSHPSPLAPVVIVFVTKTTGVKQDDSILNVWYTFTGVLHIQVQYTAEVGHAFVINSRLPLKKWVQIVISVEDTTVYVTTRQFNGHVLEREANAVHTE